MTRAPGPCLAQPHGSKLADALFLVLIAAVAGLLAYGHPEAALGVVIAFAYGTFFGNHAMQDALRKRGYAVQHIVATTKGRRGVVPSIGQTSIDGEHVRWFPPTFKPTDAAPAEWVKIEGSKLAEQLAAGGVSADATGEGNPTATRRNSAGLTLTEYHDTHLGGTP